MPMNSRNKKETPKGVSFVFATIKLELVVKVNTVEIVLISTNLIFPIEAIVSS